MEIKKTQRDKRIRGNPEYLIISKPQTLTHPRPDTTRTSPCLQTHSLNHRHGNSNILEPNRELFNLFNSRLQNQVWTSPQSNTWPNSPVKVKSESCHILGLGNRAMTSTVWQPFVGQRKSNTASNVDKTNKVLKTVSRQHPVQPSPTKNETKVWAFHDLQHFINNNKPFLNVKCWTMEDMPHPPGAAVSSTFDSHTTWLHLLLNKTSSF